MYLRQEQQGASASIGIEIGLRVEFIVTALDQQSLAIRRDRSRTLEREGPDALSAPGSLDPPSSHVADGRTSWPDSESESRCLGLGCLSWRLVTVQKVSLCLQLLLRAEVCGQRLLWIELDAEADVWRW